MIQSVLFTGLEDLKHVLLYIWANVEETEGSEDDCGCLDPHLILTITI